MTYQLLLFTINVRKSHRQRRCICLRRSRVVCVSWCECSPMWAAGIQKLNEQFISCIHLSFVNFVPYPSAQTKIRWREGRALCIRFKQLYLIKHSELYTCSNYLFILFTLTDAFTCQYIDPFFWITLYIFLFFFISITR